MAQVLLLEARRIIKTICKNNERQVSCSQFLADKYTFLYGCGNAICKKRDLDCNC